MNENIKNITRQYYDKKLAEARAKVSAKNFGWTPCVHYTVCIGWCPYCLEEKRRIEAIQE